MADLSSDELITLRRLYIRDQWIAPNGTQPKVALSRYNMALGANFWTDDDPQELHARVLAIYGPQLEDLRERSLQAHLAAGEDQATAEANADAEELNCRLGLVRAEAWSLMMVDPGFRASLMVGDDASALGALIGAWNEQIEQDYALLNETGNAGIATVALERR